MTDDELFRVAEDQLNDGEACVVVDHLIPPEKVDGGYWLSAKIWIAETEPDNN